MKTTLVWTMILFTLSLSIGLPHIAAEDPTKFSLPEGAKARLDKGSINEIAYSPDSTRLVVASSIGIWIYDAETGEELDLLTGHTSSVNSVSFSPDGETLATGSSDETIRLWDTNTGSHIHTLTGHTDYVRSVSFSPDGETLASGSRDKTIRLRDTNTGSHIRTLTGHTDYVRSVSFSPDGETLASGSSDRTVRLWDVNTGSHIRTLTGHTSNVNSVFFSPDGETLASGSWDATVRLWDVNTGSHIRTLTGHTGYVISVSFSPDGETLASGSVDGTVLLWDLTFYLTPKPAYPAWDVNEDGSVNILDLVLVGQNIGGSITAVPRADVNGDGSINILDLVLVAGHFGESTNAAAPDSVVKLEGVDPALVEKWLELAQLENDGSSVFRQGIANLERLLVSLIPQETALLANYPNPFNPETWIPYQLAKPVKVSISIYAADGKLIRTLALGHQVAGVYHNRNRAAYWDGKNSVGESVASGVFFYTLKAGDFTATRKMLILK